MRKLTEVHGAFALESSDANRFHDTRTTHAILLQSTDGH